MSVAATIRQPYRQDPYSHINYRSSRGPLHRYPAARSLPSTRYRTLETPSQQGSEIDSNSWNEQQYMRYAHARQAGPGPIPSGQMRFHSAQGASYTYADPRTGPPDAMLWEEVGMTLEASPSKPASQSMPPPAGGFQGYHSHPNYSRHPMHADSPIQGMEYYSKSASLQSVMSTQSHPSTGDESDPIAELASHIEQPVAGSNVEGHNSDNAIAVLEHLEANMSRYATQPGSDGAVTDNATTAVEHEAWSSMSFELDVLDQPTMYDGPAGQGMGGMSVCSNSMASDVSWNYSLEDVRATRAIQPKKFRTHRKYAVKQPQKSRLNRGGTNYSSNGERTNSGRSIASDGSRNSTSDMLNLLPDPTNVKDPMTAAAIIAATGGISPSQSLSSLLSPDAAKLDDTGFPSNTSTMQTCSPTVTTAPASSSTSVSMEVSLDTATTSTNFQSESINKKEKNRGNYKCGLCGKPKVNHVCEFSPLVAKETQVQSVIIDHTTMKPKDGERVLTVNSSRKSIQRQYEEVSTSEVRYGRLVEKTNDEGGEGSSKHKEKKKKSSSAAATVDQPPTQQSGFSFWCRTETGEFNCGRLFCFETSTKKN